MNEFLNSIKDFFANNQAWTIILDAYLALLVVSFFVFMCIKIRKALYLCGIGTLLYLIKLLAEFLNLKLSNGLYTLVMASYLVICVIILAPDLRKLMETRRNVESKKEIITGASQSTKDSIADAVFNMAAQKVGALITIERNNSLDQYAERAINLNSDITRELLEQIFIKDSPLHDGGVIIRGNKIICAAAYYNLAQDIQLDKTTGSRHRAGIGISQVTDAITIIVSEETGSVHMTFGGTMKIIDSKNDLLKFIDLYLGSTGDSL